MRAEDAVGGYGERVAVRHLQQVGMAVLARNWRGELGELDVVARDGDCLVVCEVKTRRSLGTGHPFEAVTPQKLARLRRLAAAWMSAHGVHPPQVRLDVVSVLRPLRGPAQVEHLRGVG